MNIDPQKVLKDNTYYKILSRYAADNGVDFRNKVWFTGTKEGSDKLYINFLFESKGRGLYFDSEKQTTVPLGGIIVKDRYEIDTEKNIEIQIIDNYGQFFDYVMKSHFTNQ